MKVRKKVIIMLFIICSSIVYAGLGAYALSYDYTTSIECLANPLKAQYGGGIINNPELNKGLRGWSSFGGAKLEHRESKGNNFVVASRRTQPYDSVSQKLYLRNNTLYTFSAWIQMSYGNFTVRAVFKTTGGTYTRAGAIFAQSNCWSMLKGGLTVDSSGPAELFFESDNISSDIWVDSISLQPFTHEEWRSHQYQSTEKTRKTRVKFQAVHKGGKPIANATILIEQKSSSFPFGSAINKNILNNTAYQKWFTSRFKFTTISEEMKWYSTEYMQGKEDYSAADAMLEFAKQHNVLVRGHNIFWDDPNYQPSWVSSLSPTQLASAAEKRLNSIVSRYKGQLIAWDIVNENLHFNFFESKLGRNASERFFNEAHQIDGTTTLFLNEYNTIENNGDGMANPARYLEKLREIQSYPGNDGLPIGIGLESHFSIPNLPYMRASIDTLGATGLPIWLTELDVDTQPQAEYLEEILREAHSHPKVKGIIMWTAWDNMGCYKMCLTDGNFKNLPTGDVVDKLLGEWGMTRLEGTTDSNGVFEAFLFHGDYEVKATYPPSSVNHSIVQRLQVVPASEAYQKAMLLQFSA